MNDPHNRQPRGVDVVRSGPRALNRWRASSRIETLNSIVRHTVGLSWDRELLLLLLDELQIDDLFDKLIGKPQRVPKARYPQAIAVAIALRHSWRPDDLGEIAKRLGLGDLSETTPTSARGASPKKSRRAKSRPPLGRRR